jgi:hypothetical protein
LRQWFDELWSATTSPLVDETSAYISWLDEDSRCAPQRRQKVALTRHSHKVRARLAKMEPLPRQATGLDLTVVAQELVVRDQLHYSSVEAAVLAGIDALAANGFSLGELVAHTKSSAIREIYFLVLQHCANHPRSVFIETTINRLIVSDGRFVQSTHDRLTEALAKFDGFLVQLISRLDFDTPRLLDTEAAVEALTGIPGRDQVILIAELLDCNWLQLMDVPGSLPLYTLADDFDWSGRFHFFQQAAARWIALKNKPKRVYQAAPVDKDFDEFYGFASVPEFESYSDSSVLADAVVQRQIAVGRKNAAAAKQREELRHKTEIDRGLARLLAWLQLNSGKYQVFGSKDLAALLLRETGIGKQLLKKLLEPNDIPKVHCLINQPGFAQKRVEPNPQLSAEQLLDFPLTAAVLTGPEKR